MTNYIKFQIGDVVNIKHDTRENYKKKYTIMDIKGDYYKLLRVADQEPNEILNDIHKDCLVLSPDFNSFLKLGDRVCFIFNTTKPFIITSINGSLNWINIIAEDLSCSFDMLRSNILKKYEE